MKTVAMVLVGGVVILAIYEIFKGNAGISALFTGSGQISPRGVSVPGVPVYSNVAVPTNNSGTMLAAATIATAAADAFGPTENQNTSDDDDLSDLVSTQFSGLGYGDSD